VSDPRHDVWIDPIRRRQLAGAVSFVESIHHYVDPDFFSIAPEELTTWSAVLDGGDEEEEAAVSVEVSYRELFRLEVIVTVAWEYSVREKRVVGEMNDETFRDLLAWMARLQDRLFRRPD